MGRAILVDFEDFVHEIQIESNSAPRSVSNDDVGATRAALQALFKKSASPSEDQIAETFVKVVNNHTLCRDYAVSLLRYRYSPGALKVAAALYRTLDAQPGEGAEGAAPSWAHIRLCIEFKKGGAQLEPFNDDDPDHPEASASCSAAVRAQLIAYACEVFLHQHRNVLYSLFINGKEFRILRWDRRSGVIVTKKQDYVANPRPLLEFLACFESLSDNQQGIDHTATLLDSNCKAYKLMDDLARAHPCDMPHTDKTEIPPLDAASSLPNPPASPLPVIPKDRSTTPKSPISAVHQGPAFGTRQRIKHARQLHPDTHIVSDDTDPPEIDEGYLDEIEESEGAPERVFRYVRDRFRESIDPESGWPRYKIEVGDERRPFLIGKPIFFSTSIFGRGTRGYVALDVKTRRFVFLKDSWRPIYVGVEPEGHYLELLSSDASVSIDVPRLVTHGDVADHHAFTALYARHPQAKLREAEGDDEALATSNVSEAAPIPSQASLVAGQKRAFEEEDLSTDADALSHHDDGESLMESESGGFQQYRHYRVVVWDVCLPFTEIVSSTQLIRLIYQCITTHARAYKRYSLLHRDISAGNVIIRPHLREIPGRQGWNEVVWTGILTDWELAKVVPKDGTKQAARQSEHTGTWQFMSVAYVEDHPTPVTVADELESFFHVTLFYAVRLLRHNISDVRTFVVNYFDAHHPGGGFGRTCSEMKTFTIERGMIHLGTLRVLFYLKNKDEHTELNNLFDKWLKFFRARYAVRAWKRQSARTAKLRSPRASHGSEDSAEDLELSDDEGALDVSTLEETAEEPSAHDKEIAKALDKHVAVQHVFVEALSGRNRVTGKKRVVGPWPKDDAVADLFPEPYDQRESLLAIDHLVACTVDSVARSGHPHKRARTQESSSRLQAASSTQLLPGGPVLDEIPASRAPTGKGRGSQI
ncbi:hypothetical protein C8Q79DRAFT_1014033 [Trametes meyenii]|nr:hypothetical protein C8Q79DRAFT_1014033 [Trametes meyenii]